jgi:hypothetical protein
MAVRSLIGMTIVPDQVEACLRLPAFTSMKVKVEFCKY